MAPRCSQIPRCGPWFGILTADVDLAQHGHGNDTQCCDFLALDMCQKIHDADWATHACTGFAKAEVPKANPTTCNPLSMLLPSSVEFCSELVLVRDWLRPVHDQTIPV